MADLWKLSGAIHPYYLKPNVHSAAALQWNSMRHLQRERPFSDLAGGGLPNSIFGSLPHTSRRQPPSFHQLEFRILPVDGRHKTLHRGLVALVAAAVALTPRGRQTQRLLFGKEVREGAT